MSLSFYKQLSTLIKQCEVFQKKTEKNNLLFTEPYQSQYLEINKLLKVFNANKLELEEVAAGPQSAPGMDSMTPAREEYYALEEKIPPFLAGEHKRYYFLKTYMIRCIHLLKTFSYSSFKGDWAKMSHLRSWLAAINNEQEKHNAEASIKKSIEDLKKLGDFEKLDPNGLQLLEEEVKNLQALLKENPNLEENLSPDDAELLANAAEYLKENEHLIEHLPELDNSFKYEEPPILEAVADRCTQLLVLADDFADDHDKKTKAIGLFEFKQELRDAFNLNIGICNDIYNAILKAIGSHKKPNIKALCRMLHKALDSYADLKKLNAQYGKLTINEKTLDVERGLPDTIDMELYLMIAVGEM